MTPKKLPQHPCPRCRNLADWYDNPYRPFCSERCRILDLGAWASEEYRVPEESANEQEEDQEESDQKESQDDESASF